MRLALVVITLHTRSASYVFVSYKNKHEVHFVTVWSCVFITTEKRFTCNRSPYLEISDVHIWNTDVPNSLRH